MGMTKVKAITILSVVGVGALITIDIMFQIKSSLPWFLALLIFLLYLAFIVVEANKESQKNKGRKQGWK